MKYWFYTSVLVLLSGCYCQESISGNSSVRFLTSLHRNYICHALPSGEHTVHATVYTTDPRFEELDFSVDDHSNPRSMIDYIYKYRYGLRMETFYQLGDLPVPVFGLGGDYSFSRFDAGYYSQNEAKIEYRLNEMRNHRLNLSASYVTFLRKRTLGYVIIEPGMKVAFRKVYSLADEEMNDKYFTMSPECRIGYGFHYYFRPHLNLNLELGYGAGAFVRGGIGVWIF